MSARSDFLRRRADLLRRINASVTGVTIAFKKLTLAEMHAGYDAVTVEFEDRCRDDPLCATRIKTLRVRIGFQNVLAEGGRRPSDCARVSRN